MQIYTLWYCGALLVQQILMLTAKDHNTALVNSYPPLCLSLQSRPPCGIYQYCNVEISSNVYSGFQVSRSFKKAPLPNNGVGTFNSTGITAVPLTRKKPRAQSLGRSQHYFSLCLRLCVLQCESHPWNVTQHICSPTAVHSLKHWALLRPQNKATLWNDAD